MIGFPFQQYLPGVAVSAALAVAAMVVSSRYGAPAMLMGLLLGMACHFVSDIKRMQLGLDLMAGTRTALWGCAAGFTVDVCRFSSVGLAICLVFDGCDCVDDRRGHDRCTVAQS